MQQRPPPAYQEYAAHLLSDRTFRLLSLAQRGLYYTLKLECWVNGSVPSDPAKLSAILGYSVAEISSFMPDLTKWFVVKGGELISPELENYRAHLQDIQDKRKHAGAKGGKSPRSKALEHGSKCLPNAKQMPSKLSSVQSSSVQSNPVFNEGIDSEWINAYDQGDAA